MMDMNMLHDANIDLNLFPVFAAVMAERNATRAAARLGLTQPAVSHALARLRHIYGDPLFVRTPRGLVPAPAAVDLAPVVEAMLGQARLALGRQHGFAPATATRRFVVGMSDYAAAVVLPPVTRELFRLAPGVTIVAKPTSSATGHAMLDAGEVELIAGSFPPPPSHLAEEELFRETFSCALARTNPLARKRWDLDRYCSGQHLQVSSMAESFGYVDRELERMGRERTVKLTVTDFLLAPVIAAESNLVATEPSRLFSQALNGKRLIVRKPPFPIPGFPVVQAWHRRQQADPGLAWLRGLFRSSLTVQP